MAKKFSDLEARMSPERLGRAKGRAREMMAEMLISEIRKEVGLTQEDLARTLDIKQPSLSKLEAQNDMQISTLRRIIRALGGGTGADRSPAFRRYSYLPVRRVTDQTIYHTKGLSAHAYLVDDLSADLDDPIVDSSVELDGLHTRSPPVTWVRQRPGCWRQHSRFLNPFHRPICGSKRDVGRGTERCAGQGAEGG